MCEDSLLGRRCRRLALFALSLVALLGIQTSAEAHSSKRSYAKMTLDEREKAQLKVIKHDLDVLRFFRKRTHFFHVQHPHNHVARKEIRFHAAQLRWTRKELKETRNAIRIRNERRIRATIGNESHWNCIHRYEGAWNSNTGNGYFGGLQMDMSFQEAHGLDLLRAKSTANNWTVYEQMMVAQRAYNGVRTSDNGKGGVSFWQDSPRRYNPWPNTARKCGLL